MNMQQFQKNSCVNSGLQPFLKGKSYLEMRILSPILNLSFRFSCSRLLYRMDRKSDFLTCFGIKSTDQFFSGNQGSDKFRHSVNVLVSKVFHVTVKYIFQGSYCTFSKGSLGLSHCRRILYFFSLPKFFEPSSKFRSLVNPNLFASIFSCNHNQNARSVSVEPFSFILLGSTVLPNRS